MTIRKGRHWSVKVAIEVGKITIRDLKKRTMELIKHLEKYLGEINEGIKLNDREYNISVSIFKNMPFEGINSYCTLGMSKYLLFHNSKEFRIELIFGSEERFEKSAIARLLLTFSERLITTGTAPFLGNVFDFNDYIYPNSRMSKLYITSPVFYQPDFQVCNTASSNVIFPWVFPIHDSEAEFIKANGYDFFESYLEENDINSFWDLLRPPLF